MIVNKCLNETELNTNGCSFFKQFRFRKGVKHVFCNVDSRHPGWPILDKVAINFVLNNFPYNTQLGNRDFFVKCRKIYIFVPDDALLVNPGARTIV